MVEKGLAALAVMAQCWEGSEPEEAGKNKPNEIWVSGCSTIAAAFSDLLQQAWLKPLQLVVSSPSLSLYLYVCVCVRAFFPQYLSIYLCSFFLNRLCTSEISTICEGMKQMMN